MVQFDANSIKQRLIDRLRSKESWSDVLFYSANMRLIEIFAEELAYDIQYDEMLTMEGKWSLARQRSSLLAETQFFNYYPHRKIGASGDLKISAYPGFNSSYPINIDIPKYTTFSNGNDISFVASEATMLLSNQTSTLVSVIQGTPKSESFIAEGDIYEKIIIYNSSIENSTVSILVNGEEWSVVPNIRESETPSSKNYVITNLNSFEGIQITFGNDYFGKKLSSGDQIVVRYIETMGSGGNIESSGLITTVESTVYDTNGSVVTIYCTNDNTLEGGLNYEEIESIRTFAPKAYSTGDRAINKDDYEFIVTSFNFIKKATVWGETETNIDAGNPPGTFLPLEENVVHISAITSSDGDISQGQETEIRDYLNQRKPPTDIIQFENVNFIYMVFNSSIFVSNRQYTLAFVSNNVRTTLQNDYSIDNLDFKTSVRYSDYVTKIDSVEGVDYHETTLQFYKFEIFNSAYTADILIYMNDITPSSVKVYIKNNLIVDTYSLIATDDGLGNFTPELGYTLGASSINYNNGTGNLIITSGLSETYSNYSIKVLFETDSTNIIATKRNQMISFGEANITVQYV